MNSRLSSCVPTLIGAESMKHRNGSGTRTLSKLQPWKTISDKTSCQVTPLLLRTGRTGTTDDISHRDDAYGHRWLMMLKGPWGETHQTWGFVGDFCMLNCG
jgi:hypothetical protein